MPLRIRWLVQPSLRAKIIVWSFVPTAIVLAAVALVGFISYQRVTEDLTIGNSRDLARLSAGQLSSELEEYGNVLEALARTSSLADSNHSVQQLALRQASNRVSIFDGGTMILDNYGLVVATEPSRPDLQGQDWSAEDFYREMVRSPNTIYSQMISRQSGGIRAIVIAVPITGEQGELLGILTGMFRLDPASTSPFYGSIVKLRIGADDTAYLIDHRGTVLYHTDPARIGDDFSSQGTVALLASGKSGATLTRDISGRQAVASYAPVPGTNWGLVIEQDWETLLASGQNYGKFLLGLLALGLVLPAIFVTLGIRRITEPIKKLIVASEEVAGGKFGEEITVKTGDELEELVKQFNLMSLRLSESYAAIKEREERLTLITERANDGIWDWDLRTQDTYFSPRWKSMLGYTDQELVNRFETWRDLIHPDDAAHAMAIVQAHIEGKTPVYHLEHRLRRKDGSYCWILARGIALRDAGGEPYRIVGSHTDITERKQSEEAMRQSEKRFSQVFRASPIAITITGLDDGHYIDVNDAWQHLFGYTHAEVIGKGSVELNIWVEPEQRSVMIQQLKATGSVRNFEHLARTRSGQLLDVLVFAEVIELNDQLYNLSLVSDITEQKQAKRALEMANQTLEQRVQERTHELATLNAIAEVVSRSLDLKEIMRDALDKTMQVMEVPLGIAYRVANGGDSAEESSLTSMVFRGASDETAQSLSQMPLHGTVVEQAALTGQPIVWRTGEYPSQSVRQVLVKERIEQGVSVPLSVKGKLVGAIILLTRKERIITPEEQTLLAAIGQQVGMAVENARLYDQAEQSAAIAERTRLARELHDSVTQSLYSVTLYAEAASRLMTSGAHAEAADHLRELRDTAQEALREMRLLIYELRPLALEKTGLAAALQTRLDAVETRGGLRAELLVSGVEHLPPSIQSEMYHIAHEALNNVLKHANAHHVSVQLRFDPTSATVEVRDDGSGFILSAAEKCGGMGLRGMYERAQKINGTLRVESAPGHGTTILVEVPLFGNPLEEHDQ
jgi:PAS domain S-box-containing protein